MSTEQCCWLWSGPNHAESLTSVSWLSGCSPLSATAVEESAGRDGQFSPGAVITLAQIRLWLVYINQGTAFVFPFSSFPN